MLTLAQGDDLVHTLVTRTHSGRPKMALTACGRQPSSQRIAQLVQHGDGCHVCLPHLAHPLARVWATCRAWDEDANANTGRNALR